MPDPDAVTGYTVEQDTFPTQLLAADRWFVWEVGYE